MSIAPDSVIIREATPADFPSLNNIEILSRPADPCWVYRLPYREQYPEDHAKFNLEKFYEFAGSTFKIMMAEVPDPKDPAGTRIPVGMALWDTAHFPPAAEQNRIAAARGNHHPQTKPNAERRDAYLPRLAPFINQHDEVKAFFFDKMFAPGGYLFLGILAVHPDYQGLGAGGKLVSWGQQQARDAGVRMGLWATHYSGPRLFDQRYGFRSLGAYVFGQEDDQGPGERHVRMEAMGWDPQW